jgi:hypothetical protein
LGGQDVGLLAQDTLGITFQYRVDPPTGSLLKARLIHVTLRNDGPGDVSIIQVELKLDADLSFSREDLRKQQLPCKSCKDPYRIEQQVASGKEIELTFEYPKGSFWLPLRNLELSNFEPGVHKLEFRAQVQNPLSPNSAKIMKYVDFDVQAPALVVCLGGAAGGLFLSLYRTGRRILRPRSKKRIVWARQLFEAGIALTLGATTALTLSLVGGFLTNKALGLQIAATSFSGGFIIGFLSCSIADMWPNRLDTNGTVDPHE